MLPGKKGITLPPDQWEKLCAASGQLTARLEAQAGPLPSPKPSKSPAAPGATPDAAPAPNPPGSISLAPLRRAEVADWKGRRMVSIREFYTDAAGELKHSRKGLQLSVEQFATLRERADDATAALEARDASFEVQLAPK